MTILKEDYVCRGKGRTGHKKRVYYNWFPVRWSRGNKGMVFLGGLTLPKEYIGKRIKLKVEVQE